MNKTKKILKGMSFKLDALFFRNLTLILATILIWRGIWNFADHYFFPGNFILSNLLTTFLGIFLLFIFDSEVESEDKKHKHLTDDLIR
jgi:uncharacterized membrane protein YbhN (UPF0104 family)